MGAQKNDAVSGLGGHVTESGRISIPAQMRRAIGLERGGPVRIDLVDGAIRIRTMPEVKAGIRALANQTGLVDKASVDDFISWRAEDQQAESDNQT